MRIFPLLAMTLALTAAACGDSDESSDEQSLVIAINAQADANPNNPLDESTTTCLAERVVSEFGVDVLANLGVTADNPNLDLGRVFETREQAERAFDLVFDCVDLEQDVLSFLPEGLDVAEESIQCLGRGLNSDTFKELFVSLVADENKSGRILDDPAARVPISQLALGCLDAEELLQMTELGG